MIRSRGTFPADVLLPRATLRAEARRLVTVALRLRADRLGVRTRRWTDHVTELAATVADTLGDRTGADEVRAWGHLRDVGEIYFGARLVAGRPYDALDIRVLQDHTVLGAALLEHAGYPAAAVRLAEQHHERIDGSGYPYGATRLSTSVQALGIAEEYVSARDGGSTHAEAMAAIEAAVHRGWFAPTVAARLGEAAADLEVTLADRGASGS